LISAPNQAPAPFKGRSAPILKETAGVEGSGLFDSDPSAGVDEPDVEEPDPGEGEPSAAVGEAGVVDPSGGGWASAGMDDAGFESPDARGAETSAAEHPRSATTATTARCRLRIHENLTVAWGDLKARAGRGPVTRGVV
jgi:hypothetical protein